MKRLGPFISRFSVRRRGSVLVIVMITLLFATFALITFMDKATNDLLVDHREVLNRRLRKEAYSALETTLSVLEEFRTVSNGLHSPAEGWGDPLTFAGYTPTEDRTIEVAFEDESGKISLPHANAQIMSRLFQAWGATETDADMIADALMGWMKPEHVYTTAVTPDYEQSAIPYEPPGRSMRSYTELAAIDKVREFFYDADGRPNDYWRRFVDSVSLLDFNKSNLNAAKPDTLAALGQFDPTQQGNLADYVAGRGQFQTKGPGYFQNPTEAQSVTGPSGDVSGFSTSITALRILITVHDGSTTYKLAAVVAPPNGATTVQATATSQRRNASAPTSQNAQRASQPNASQTSNNTANGQAAANKNLRYPFTLLEIRENDEIPPPPPPPPTDQTF